MIEKDEEKKRKKRVEEEKGGAVRETERDAFFTFCRP
jgi:hypothetical protein